MRKTAFLLALVLLAGCLAGTAASADGSAAGADALRGIRVGGSFLFGRYEQDGHPENGKEIIEWIVLEKQGTQLLLLSRNVLDRQPFDGDGNTTWANCSLRSRLNTEFVKEAFTPGEQAMLVKTAFTNRFSQVGAVPTSDKVFLLSLKESAALTDGSPCAETAYAQGREKADPLFEGCLWARDRVWAGKYAAAVYPDGASGIAPTGEPLGVRPAIRIDLARNAAEENADAPLPEAFREARIGDTVTFGRYEQDLDPENGPDPIEWTVLDRRGDMLLLISRYGPEDAPFDTGEEDVTWRGCSLRTWLNGEFLEGSFDAGEKRRILAAMPEGWHSGDTEVTTDRVFLLSAEEAKQYFATDEERRLKPTLAAVYGFCAEFCRENGFSVTEDRVDGYPVLRAARDDVGSREYIFVREPVGFTMISRMDMLGEYGESVMTFDDVPTVRWWLRDSENYPGEALVVSDSGSGTPSVDTYGPGFVAVRPVLWVDIGD